MAVVLAIDVGEKRIGLAKSDELSIIASPYGWIPRDGAVDELREIIEKENVEVLVVGMPYLPSGGLGSQAKDIEKMIEDIKRSIELPIETESEVLSSVEAEKRLREMNKNFEKGDIDAMAACILLESYLRR
jgi:putative holliday junction resolvase